MADQSIVLLLKKMLGNEWFIASMGWHDRLKRAQVTITSKILSSDEPAALEFKRTFADMIAAENNSPQQIYNDDGPKFLGNAKQKCGYKKRTSTQTLYLYTIGIVNSVY